MVSVNIKLAKLGFQLVLLKDYYSDTNGNALIPLPLDEDSNRRGFRSVPAVPIALDLAKAEFPNHPLI